MRAFVVILSLVIGASAADACDMVLPQAVVSSQAVVLGSPVQYAAPAVQSYGVQSFAVQQLPLVSVQSVAVQAQAVAVPHCAVRVQQAATFGASAKAVAVGGGGGFGRARSRSSSGGLFGFGLIGPNRARAVSVR